MTDVIRQTPGDSPPSHECCHSAPHVHDTYFYFSSHCLRIIVALNELTGVNRRMEAENRSLVEKGLMEEINELKKKAETKA